MMKEKDEAGKKHCLLKEKNFMKRVWSLICVSALILCMAFVGCGEDKNSKNAENKKLEEVETPKGEGIQFVEEKDAEVIADIEIEGYGTVTVALFKEKAPKAVENFVTLSKNGYYEGVSFHRVMKDFMIQGGDPTGTGFGGESAFGQEFEDEFSDELFPYRGALCMANAGKNTNGSQFFIVQTSQVDASYTQQLRAIGAEQIADNYEKIGGTPWLWYAHTVFGQVLDGMEVVDAVASVKTDGNNKPLEDVLIKKITIREP